MTPDPLIATASDIAFVLLIAAVTGCMVRIVRGPALADRVLALDLLSLALVAFSGTWAVRTGEVAFLDVSLALALLAFFTTVVFARYIEQQVGTPTDAEHGEGGAS